MSKGICLLAQNNSHTDYVRQAYYLSLSIKHFSPDIPVCLITNDTVSKKYKTAFDEIKTIPWNDSAQNSEWKIENRWKVFYISPYDETIVFDTDCLVLTDLNELFEKLQQQELFFTTSALNYRGEKITDDYYRKTFTHNNLPNIYTGMYYFKKTENTARFFKLLNLIFDNYNSFYDVFCKEYYPKNQSMDVNVAIACKIFGKDIEYTNKKIQTQFVHMKPMIQGWKEVPEYWTTHASVFLNDNRQLFVFNQRQQGIFHYVENEFLCNDITDILEQQYD